MYRSIRAILFDLDGVLVPAQEWHYSALNDALSHSGYDPITREQHENEFDGLSTYMKLSRLGITGCEAKDIYKLKQRYTSLKIAEYCKPNLRVCGVVAYAIQLSFKLAVVTNCSRSTALDMLKRAGLLYYFKTIVTNEDVPDGQNKPHPRPYLEARHRLGIKHKEALAIDDKELGCQSASEAWCRVWHLKNFEDLTIENFNKQIEKFRITI